MACVRTAWLTLGSLTVLLEDATKGYFCQALDIGFPQVRDVVSNRPDADGVDDRTQYMGARVVSANITALAGAGARIDDVADNFAPFMAVSARPTLHYVLDRPGAAERVLTLRASGYSWPVVGDNQRDIQLQWVAADPIIKDPNTQTVTAYAGSTFSSGRTYPLGYNRIYPTGGATPTAPAIITPGDLPVRPLLRVYGPITGAYINFSSPSAGNVTFLAGYVINAGHWVDVDTAKKTALLDGNTAQSVITAIDWVSTRWPVLLPGPSGGAQMSIQGANTTAVTQVQAIWNDGYLT